MILINSGYNRLQKLGGFSRYVPISVPLSIGYLAGYLLKHNKNVKVLDEEVVPVTTSLLEEYTLGLSEPYIFGISCLTASISRGYQLAELIKRQYPMSKVIFGNMHPTVLPEEVLQNTAIDVVVRGEGEETLNTLYERIKNGRSYEDLKGISFRKDSQIIHNDSATLPDLNAIPRFPYQLFKNLSERYELGFVASSRGCPYNCLFCSQRSISGRKFRFFPSEVVIQDIEELIYKYKRSYITFVDDSFLMNKKRVIVLCQMLKEKGFHKRAIFDCQARGDTVDEETLKLLKSAGFRTIHFGIETASERLMELIDKKETVVEVAEGIRLAKECGFQVSGTFILGLPTETKRERQAAYRLAKELSLDYVRFNNATPYPGTRLYEVARKEGRLNAGKNWENLNACGTLVEPPFREVPLAYVPVGISERELRYDVLKYNLFYSFRLESILKILKERVGPAGWLALPEGWYLSLKEWSYLSVFGVKVVCSFLKILLYSILSIFKR